MSVTTVTIPSGPDHPPAPHVMLPSSGASQTAAAPGPGSFSGFAPTPHLPISSAPATDVDVQRVTLNQWTQQIIGRFKVVQTQLRTGPGRKLLLLWFGASIVGLLLYIYLSWPVFVASAKEYVGGAEGSSFMVFVALIPYLLYLALAGSHMLLGESSSIDEAVHQVCATLAFLL